MMLNVSIYRLREISARHGFSKIVVCDNGPQFANAKLNDWADVNGLKIAHSAPFWPRANGEVERQNRSILERPKIALSENMSWRAELYDYLLIYRSSPHSTSGVSPAELLFGRKLKSKLPEIDVDKNLDEEVRHRDAWIKNHRKQYFDNRYHAEPSGIVPGDPVLVKAAKENKLSTNFKPTEYTVTSRTNNTVTVQSPDDVTYTRKTSFVKKFNDTPRKPTANEASDEPLRGHDPDSAVSKDSSVSSDHPVVKRPRPDRGAPKKFDDFVM